MPELEQKDILIKLRKKYYLDGVSWTIWHDGFETSYPSETSFLIALDKYIRKRLGEIDYRPVLMEYRNTGRTYGEEMSRLTEIIYNWHNKYTTLTHKLRELKEILNDEL